MLKKVKYKLLELLAYHWDKYFDKERYSNLRTLDKALRNASKCTSAKKNGLIVYWEKQREEHIQRRKDV